MPLKDSKLNYQFYKINTFPPSNHFVLYAPFNSKKFQHRFTTGKDAEKFLTSDCILIIIFWEVEPKPSPNISIHSLPPTNSFDTF